MKLNLMKVGLALLCAVLASTYSQSDDTPDDAKSWHLSFYWSGRFLGGVTVDVDDLGNVKVRERGTPGKTTIKHKEKDFPPVKLALDDFSKLKDVVAGLINDWKAAPFFDGDGYVWELIVSEAGQKKRCYRHNLGDLWDKDPRILDLLKIINKVHSVEKTAHLPKDDP